SPDGRRMLEAIDSLPEDEREAFDLVRIQGLTYAEAAGLLGVAPKTVQRRLDRGLQLLTERLGDLGPAEQGLGMRDETIRVLVSSLIPHPSSLQSGRLPCQTNPASKNCSTNCSTVRPPRRRSAARARNCCPSFAGGGGRSAGRGPNSTRCSRSGRTGASRRCRRRTSPCRKSPATRSSPSSVAAEWGWSTGPETCAWAASSPSR